jgi:hypothetical protein
MLFSPSQSLSHNLGNGIYHEGECKQNAGGKKENLIMGR